MAQIFIHKEAPPLLVRIIDGMCQKTPIVKKVIIDAFIKDLQVEGRPPALGAFDPDNGIIVLDLGACLTDKRWMEMGIQYIPNVWFNMLFAFFHELAHAEQLTKEPDIKDLDFLPDDYEIEACERAEELLLDWTNENKIPPVEEMGWTGVEIMKTMNALYNVAPDLINEEMKLNGTNAVAQAMVAAKLSGNYEDQDRYDMKMPEAELTKLPENIRKGSELESLIFHIHEGYAGVTIDGKQYLTANEAINLTHNRKAKEEAA